MERYWTALGGELLKVRRSTIGLLVVLGALFVPAIVLLVRLRHPAGLPAVYADPSFWSVLWNSVWEANAVILVPMLIMLLVSQVVQIEYRNNTWKQVHATPIHPATVYLAKLTVILGYLVTFFAVVNLATYLTAVLPRLGDRALPDPSRSFPLAQFAARSFDYLIDNLPIVGLQYLLALHFRSFVVPLGIGMGLWLGVIGCISWEYIYVMPYGYHAIDFLRETSSKIGQGVPIDLQALAVIAFLLFTLIGLGMFVSKPERG
ncbi:MAG: ABC transporter permease [Candidatus Eisenbacteria bacterium]|nr:ABC transporter permease [Candidatus Eisenbacteria bacterium]